MRLRFGNLEKGLFIYIIGLVPIVLLIIINKLLGLPFWYNLLLILAMFMNFMGVIWIIIQVRKNRATPMIDEAGPEEVKAIRVTKDGIIIPQFVPKGLYGVAETIIYGRDADFHDEADFPLRTIDGSPAILIFDWLNTAIDVRRSVARKHWKKYSSPNGPSAYEQAKKQNKVDNYGKKQ